MDPCEDCQNLQEQSKGPASPRAKYNQPTMYDHLETFKNFKKTQEKEHQIQEIKQELIKPNEKFTNLAADITNIEEYLKNFSTQDIAKFKAGDIDFPTKAEKTPQDLKETAETPEEAKKPENVLLNVSRSPIFCPVTACHQTTGVTSVLSHFLQDHRSVDFQETIESRRSLMVFEEKAFVFDENICLGILAYGGKNEISESCPALMNVCRPNSFLPEKHSKYTNHLPILIMGCKTSLCTVLNDKELAKQLKDPADASQHIIAIWLATVDTTKKICATITAFSEDMLTSRGLFIEVKNLKDSQDPSDFLHEGLNYLMLSRGDIDLLSEKGESAIELEILIHEFDN